MTFFKKNWLILTLSFLVGVLLFLKLLIKITPKTQQVNQSNTWKQITPQISTQKDLEKKLGPPLETQKEKEYIVYFYPSEVENWPTKIYISEKDKKVSLVKLFFPKENFQNLLNQLGPPDKQLFGPHEGAGLSVFVLSKKGVAAIANQESGIILELWYFPPTTLENFIALYGEGLKTSPSQKF